MAMSKVALTYRDYAALPDDGRRYQLLDGDLFVTAAPGTRRQLILMRLSAQLHAHVTENRLGLVLPAPADSERRGAWGPFRAPMSNAPRLFPSRPWLP